MKKQQQQSKAKCVFVFCNNDAVRFICYDSNSYENDKYAWACEDCARKYEEK